MSLARDEITKEEYNELLSLINKSSIVEYCFNYPDFTIIL